MPRAVDGTRRTDRRKKLLKHVKGYWGRRSKLLKSAKEAMAKALTYAYRDRKARKRAFRSLWIIRISAMCRQHDTTYSKFIDGLNKANIIINRKALSNMAIEDPKAFVTLIEKSKQSVGA